jgi:3-oxoacyl-[acyl-carrier protein] reductase
MKQTVNGNISDHKRDGCALVTGASRGIGAAIARTIAADGWAVALNYSSDADGAAAVAEEIAAASGRALPVQADVADPDAVDEMFGTIEQELGTVLVLVNNAGIRHDRLLGGLDTERWLRVIDVNLNGTFHTMKRAIGPMVRRRYGRIVNISSISATRTLPGQSAYAASKAAVEALTRTSAIEFARRNVTINAVAPGLVATGFVRELKEDWAGSLPARRIAQPEEVARCVRFLTSEDAAYVSGALLTVDGALSAGLGVLSPGSRPGAKAKSGNE